MKDSFYDIALQKLKERNDIVGKKLNERFKGQKPFGLEPVPDETVINAYLSMNEEDETYVIQKYGEDAFWGWVTDVEKKIAKRNGGNQYASIG